MNHLQIEDSAYHGLHSLHCHKNTPHSSPILHYTNPQKPHFLSTTMANADITKGSTVEVGSDEPGFHGAWYVAQVLDKVEPSSSTKKKSSSKKLNKPRYLVKYATLLEEDSDDPLIETVDLSFVRPLPPSNIRRNNDGIVKEAEVMVLEGNVNSNSNSDGDGDFELYDVVDAYHRDGWWQGVVKTVIVEEGEMRKYVVSFENPYEEYEFEKSKLRLHVDWVDSHWLIPPKKTPDEELGDRNASDDAQSGFTTPSSGTAITHVDNVAVGSSLSTKKNSRPRTRSETSSVVDISVTYSRNKRNANLVDDGSQGKRSKSSTGSKGNTKAIVPVSETGGCDDINQDSPRVEDVINITVSSCFSALNREIANSQKTLICHCCLQQTREAEDGKSHQKRKRGRKAKLAVNKPIDLLQDEHEFSDIDEAPLSVWFKGMRALSLLKRSSCISPPDKSPNQAIVASDVGAGAGTTTTATTVDYQQKWPFIKRAPIWVAIESLELYKKPPQKPHFSPLKKTKMDYREGLAIAFMVTYGNLVQSLEDLQLNDSVDIIKANLETLCELETHGFDVGAIRGRLNELLSLISKVGPHKDKRKEVENELEKCNHEKSEAEKEMDRLKAKMQELKEKTAQTAAMKKTKEEEIVKLQTNLDLVSKEIKDWEVAFEKLCKKGLTLD
ncbi:putative Agenet-like domain-containing protein [Helianthus anomalus]